MIIRQTGNLFELTVDENPVQPEEPVEPTEPQHKCKDCPNSYPTATGLGLHRKTAHPDEYNEEEERWRSLYERILTRNFS